MNARRNFLLMLGAGALAQVFPAYAQQSGKPWRIGILERSANDYVEAFKRGLLAHGYVEGKNIVFEYRWSGGNVAEFPRLAAELARLPVDVILAGGTPNAMAARDATRTIPIVFAVAADLVGVKLIDTLPRPGGNVTGMTTNNVEVAGKRLEMLKEMVGGKLARAGMLFNPADASNVLTVQMSEAAARKLGISYQGFPVARAQDFEAAFSAMAAARIDGLTVSAGVLTNSNAKRIAELAAKLRLPAIYSATEFADVGGLASYSASFSDNYRRAATYVDKILKGAAPRDLPVEQAEKYELVINRRTAKALGIAIPQSLLLQAERVIE